MTPRDFIYWLNGYLELSPNRTLSAAQLKVVKDHLALVLTNVTNQGEPGAAFDPVKWIKPQPITPWTVDDGDSITHPQITCSNVSDELAKIKEKDNKRPGRGFPHLDRRVSGGMDRTYC